jgi:hypothetical protein
MFYSALSSSHELQHVCDLNLCEPDHTKPILYHPNQINASTRYSEIVSILRGIPYIDTLFCKISTLGEYLHLKNMCHEMNQSGLLTSGVTFWVSFCLLLCLLI